MPQKYEEARIQRFTSSEWSARNPILERGILVLELDTLQLKCGDGYTRYNDLKYIGPFSTNNTVISPPYLPPEAISETFVVGSQAAMLAVAAQTGDIAIRTDVLQTFILSGTTPSLLADWTQFPVPTDVVTSVNGEVGVVILDTSLIPDSLNARYVTDADLTTLSNTSGTNTGDQTTITGNAGTATALATSRNINGVAFDGTSDITVTAASSTLTGATLAPNVLASSLTSVGTLSALSVTATIIGSISGNAATVTTNANLTGAVTSVGNATSLGSFTSADLAAAITDETGTGAAVFSASPSLVTPLLGTPTSGVLTNCTGTAAGLTAGNVTTNANLTGPVTSVGNATSVTADAITNTMLANMATQTFKGRTTAGTGDPEDLSLAQLQAALSVDEFTSANQVITSAGALTLAHGLGRTPHNFELFLVNAVAELGYTIGNAVAFGYATLGNNQGVAVTADGTNIYVRYGSSASVFNLPNKATGAVSNITPASWRLRIYAE